MCVQSRAEPGRSVSARDVARRISSSSRQRGWSRADVDRRHRVSSWIDAGDVPGERIRDPDRLDKDAAIPAGPARPGEFSLGQPVQSRAEVDELSRGPKPPGRPSPRRATGRGASTPATSATWTATFGRSSGTRIETDLARPRVTFPHAGPSEAARGTNSSPAYQVNGISLCFVRRL
jgi:hypothetical protein